MSSEAFVGELAVTKPPSAGSPWSYPLTYFWERKPRCSECRMTIPLDQVFQYERCVHSYHTFCALRFDKSCEACRVPTVADRARLLQILQFAPKMDSHPDRKFEKTFKNKPYVAFHPYHG